MTSFLQNYIAIIAFSSEETHTVLSCICFDIFEFNLQFGCSFCLVSLCNTLPPKTSEYHFLMFIAAFRRMEITAQMKQAEDKRETVNTADRLFSECLRLMNFK